MKGLIKSRAFNRKYNYHGSDLGVSYNAQVSLFKVWSPKAASVSLVLYSSGDGDTKLEEIPMNLYAKGIWSISVHRDLKGVYYTYKVCRGESTYEVVDPYAKACGVNGNRGMIIDLAETNPEGWDTHSIDIVKKATDAIIYEVHIRDLSIDDYGNIKHKGKYLAFTENGTKSKDGMTTGIDHIKELGVTHVQLMPCYDYLTVDETKSTEYNWGYDPLNYNIPEGSYSTDPYHGEVRIKEFKQAIMALHEQGLGVIMDVVYNHTAYSEDSPLNKLVPNYYYRTNGIGRFYNGSACGNEIASERHMVRKMIADSLIYWAKEYKIDGFRFDLMGILDIQTMNYIHQELSKINPNIILYGEGWAGGPCGIDESQRAVKVNAPQFRHIGVFNDDLRDGIRGHVFEAEQKGFINDGVDTEESVKFGIVAATRHPQINYAKVNYSDAPYACSPSQTINYASAHDNLTLWDKIEVSMEDASLEEKVKMQKLANAIVLTSQGVPFIHAGAEFARTKGGDENSYKSGDLVNQLDWKRKAQFKEVYEYYKGLIELRKKHPAFRMQTTREISEKLRFLEIPTERVIGYTLNHHAGNDEWGTIAVLFNGNVEGYKVQLPEGNWKVVVNGKRAGVDIIETIEGSEVEIEGRTAMVLFKA
ncbi:MAG: type I pullulanase [Cellulosilyticum sp.]|nr:type I pullulanase [Cellulosilyticum sp.]